MAWKTFERLTLLLLALGFGLSATAAERIPHHQSKPPNPPRSPQEAIEKMTVPPGFQVELVASEPEIINPIGMTFDERGRIWITESVEYPRRSAGKGRDRVKILEDTNGDGSADKVTIFAEGLNIPSGIAVGHGGVWVANAPDMLFMRDTDGDDKADEVKVVVTGFGRSDTHELPNSLTWGPDGWLYGLNGVFNHSHVKHRDKEYRFTCALFRINPRADQDGPWQGTHDFELFCEGTSNPWGVAFDTEGSAFISACVIDHLWHLTETGYYHRQGGPYPPFTWKIGSIVRHKHQMAAYCGLDFFDSDAYPPEYREKLYMGNIHGGCINADELTREGSTYLAKPRSDFLSANDAWFMPVVQKTGPDGCLYVLDWYDRYHCYQDANRDPKGLDRSKGRLYRVRYKETPRAPKFDLAKETNDQLIQRLASANKFYRDIAQRLLVERSSAALAARLEKLVMDTGASRKTRLHALWALVGTGSLRPEFHEALLAHDDATFRAWGVRAAGNMGRVAEPIRQRIIELASEDAPDVQLQVIIAARKLEGVDAIELLTKTLAHSGEDQLMPHIVWQNLHPMLDDHAEEFLAHVQARQFQSRPSVAQIMPRVTEKMLAAAEPDAAAYARLFAMLRRGGQHDTAGRCLASLARGIQSRVVSAEQLAKLRPQLEPSLHELLAGDPKDPLYLDAAIVAATWQDAKAVQIARKVFVSDSHPDARRAQALEALVVADNQILDAVADVLNDPQSNSVELRRRVLGALGRRDEPRVAEIVLSGYAKLEPALRPVALELLSQRPVWSLPLLAAIKQGKVSRDEVNLTQLRKLIASGNSDVIQAVESIWGKVRTDRNPQRDQVIQRVRSVVQKDINQADIKNGRELFTKKCAVCHVMHGKGEKVGPDISVNGRGSFAQLLSNVLDPNLVIGADYQARIVITNDGRTLSGLLAEENDQRVVLNTQGGKSETIARRDIDELSVSSVSLMPENLEDGMSDQEIVDLFAYLSLDLDPDNPAARFIPGVAPLQPQETIDRRQFRKVMNAFAPGFSVDRVGERGLAIVSEHFGRNGVLRTHPVDRQRPCVIYSQVDVPLGKKTHLVLGVSHDAGGGDRDWRLIIKADGKTLHDAIVGEKSTRNHWADLKIDLSRFAGRRVKLELLNQANNWSYEFAYWDNIRIVSQ